MTIPTFPTLLGLTYPIMWSPEWRTIVQEAISGKDTRIQLWTYPRYKFTLPVSRLVANGTADWQTLVGLYNSVGGGALPFHFNWSYDNAATNQALGTGNAVQPTGNTHGTTTVDSLSSITGIVVGMQITGANIQAGTTILAIPTGSSITLSQTATGSASGSTFTIGTAAFNFIRFFGGFIEPMQDVTQGTETIKVNAVTKTVVTDYTYLTDPDYGLTYGINFNVAPLNTLPITGSFSYNWACRFESGKGQADDTIEFSNFQFNYWEAKKITFETMKVL